MSARKCATLLFSFAINYTSKSPFTAGRKFQQCYGQCNSCILLCLILSDALIQSLSYPQVPDGATVALIPRSSAGVTGINQIFQTGESKLLK